MAEINHSRFPGLEIVVQSSSNASLENSSYSTHFGAILSEISFPEALHRGDDWASFAMMPLKIIVSAIGLIS
ncbi:hypothetical protein SUGI_1170210 [Cryptomeria japonica]|nr:hypothetical protein SUGI_1170210 [Cryptomeria japonica]